MSVQHRARPSTPGHPEPVVRPRVSHHIRGLPAWAATGGYQSDLRLACHIATVDRSVDQRLEHDWHEQSGMAARILGQQPQSCNCVESAEAISPAHIHSMARALTAAASSEKNAPDRWSPSELEGLGKAGWGTPRQKDCMALGMQSHTRREESRHRRQLRVRGLQKS